MEDTSRVCTILHHSCRTPFCAIKSEYLHRTACNNNRSCRVGLKLGAVHDKTNPRSTRWAPNKRAFRRIKTRFRTRKSESAAFLSVGRLGFIAVCIDIFFTVADNDIKLCFSVKVAFVPDDRATDVRPACNRAQIANRILVGDLSRCTGVFSWCTPASDGFRNATGIRRNRPERRFRPSTGGGSPVQPDGLRTPKTPSLTGFTATVFDPRSQISGNRFGNLNTVKLINTLR